MELHGSNKAIEIRLKEILHEMKGCKLYVTIKILFKKPQEKCTLYKSAYFNSQPRIIMDVTNIDKTLGLISQHLLHQIGLLMVI